MTGARYTLACPRATRHERDIRISHPVQTPPLPSPRGGCGKRLFGESGRKRLRSLFLQGRAIRDPRRRSSGAPCRRLTQNCGFHEGTKTACLASSQHACGGQQDSSRPHFVPSREPSASVRRAATRHVPLGSTPSAVVLKSGSMTSLFLFVTAC